MTVSASTIIVSPGDSLIITGNVSLSGGSSIQDNGYLKIIGNLNLTGNSTVTGSGHGIVTGVTTGTGWTTTLPVTLVSLEATVGKNNSVGIRWETASEINNAHFDLSRSSNGIDFKNIATIREVGNSTIVHDYSYSDKNPSEGLNYYRLKQVDYDGR